MFGVWCVYGPAGSLCPQKRSRMCAVQLLRVSVHERISAAAEDVLLRVGKREEAAEIPALRALLTERLTAAAEEIVGLFEETVAEYEDRAERSEREICRQRRLLDAVLKPQVKLTRADVQQLLLVKEEALLEQQRWSSSLDQEDPEPPHIKEEQEELWTSQEGEQLQGLEEADITKFTFTPVHVKSEDDEEKPQSSPLHQRQTEQMETEADGEDCGGPEPARNSDPDRHPEPDTVDKTGDSSEPETDNSDEWEETREPQSGLNSLNNDEVPVSDFRCGCGEKPFGCSECDKRFGTKTHLKEHMRIHTGEKPFSCTVCGKRFSRKGHLTQHMPVHTGEKRFSCSVCNRRFAWRYQVKMHKCVGHQSSQLHQTQTEENREAEPPASSSTEHMKTEADREDCGGPEPARNSDPDRHPEPDTVQQLLVSQEEVPPEQQEWSSSLDQEDPEPPHIKEEQEELWTSQEGEQLQGLEEADTTKFTFTPVPVKSEHDEEKPQSSKLHQRQTEQMETEADGEECGGPEPARNSDPDRHPEPDTDGKTGDSSEPETEHTDDWKETREPQSGLNSLKNDEIPVVDSRCSAGEKPFSCSECGKRFSLSGTLKRHMRSHKGEKPFSCSVCKNSFARRETLRTHMRIHTGEKPFTCSVCAKSFLRKAHLKRHMMIHTGEKPFNCSVCGKSFTQAGSLRQHISIHTGDKRYSCSICDRRFPWYSSLKHHHCIALQSS